MPELAEVEFYRKQWSPGLGQTIEKVLLHPKARIFREADSTAIGKALKGSRLVDSLAHGKQMCFRFSNDSWLGIHLGMSGRLQTAHPEIVPSRHEHLVLVTDKLALVFTDPRMFGKVLHDRSASPPVWWAGLPPQPQESAFDRKRFREILSRHPRQPLKALLLDQESFPGVGNWMADEILWRARIHPASRPLELSAYKRGQLFGKVKEVCADALRVIGTDWGNPPDSWLFNHRWKRGGTCPVSGQPLEFITVGGRTTCYSPAIQKA